MDNSIMNMICSHIEGKKFKDKAIIEIGSRQVSGPSVRRLFESIKPKKYHGIDIVDGDGVDEVISISDFCKTHDEKFDCVVCTEVFEHYKNWWELFECLTKVVNDQGLIVFTTPGKNFPFHPHEEDFWRVDEYDLKTVFGCVCEDLHCKDSFITQSSDKKHIFAKVVFEKETFNKRRLMFDFMLKNMKMHNVLVGEKISPTEWQEMGWN